MTVGPEVSPRPLATPGTDMPMFTRSGEGVAAIACQRRPWTWLQDHLLWLVLLGIIGVVTPWSALVNQLWLTLQAWRETTVASPWEAGVLFVGLALLITGLPVPGPTAMILAVLSGWLFHSHGWLIALVLVSFCTSLGAVLAFSLSRRLLRDSVLLHRAAFLQRWSANWRLDSGLALFVLRINPCVPYFALNLLYGRSTMHVGRFWLMTLLGMAPLSAIYVGVGASLAQIDQLSTATMSALFPLALLSVVPVLLYGIGLFARRLLVN